MPRVGSKKFWIQTHLRNQRQANTVNIRLMKYEDRYKRLWSIYHHLWDHYCETAQETLPRRRVQNKQRTPKLAPNAITF